MFINNYWSQVCQWAFGLVAVNVATGPIDVL